MEWNKTAMTKTELEKKQREFIEEAMRMAKKAGHNPEKSTPVIEQEEEAEVWEEEIEAEISVEEDVMCENDVECDSLEQPALLPSDEASEELTVEEEPPAVEEWEEEKQENEEETTYGVFDADELIDAIENGEITGDGLKQAAEILREMTEKTKTMKKLLEEQESRIASEKKSNDGSQIGLNSYIDRHNTGCRGCRNGKFNTH